MMFCKCVICISTFRTDDVIYSLQCGHVFHEECLRTLQEYQSPRCPLCRSGVISQGHRLFFATSPDATLNDDSLNLNDLKNEVQEKTEKIQNLEKEISKIRLDYDKQIKVLETKLKKGAKSNIDLKRDLKSAKDEQNKTKTENKKLSAQYKKLLKKMEGKSSFNQNNNIIEYQNEVKSRLPVTQSVRGTAISKRAASMMPKKPLSTAPPVSLHSNPSSIKTRLRSFGNPVFKETAGGDTSIHKGPEAFQNVKKQRSRTVNGEIRPLRNL